MANKNAAPTKNAPAHEIRLGAIKATIWENETPTGKRHKDTIARLYKYDEECNRT